MRQYKELIMLKSLMGITARLCMSHPQMTKGSGSECIGALKNKPPHEPLSDLHHGPQNILWSVTSTFQISEPD